VFFADVGWEASKVEDYGIDFEVEVFREKKTIGVLFNVQLKSTEQPSYSANGDFVSVELEIPNARYLGQELETPTILIQADITQKRLFWSAPQMDAALLKTLETKPDVKTCTVRVPIKNELPATRDKLLDTVTNLLTMLAARRLTRTDTREFVAATTSMAESMRLKQELRDKANTLEIMDAQASIESGDFDGARKAIHAVLSSPQSSVEAKFFALLIEEKNEWLALRGEERYGSGHIDVMSSTAKKLRELTPNGPGTLKYYALIAQVDADFYALTRDDWGLYQNWKIHEKTGDLWWRAELRVMRAEVEPSDRTETRAVLEVGSPKRKNAISARSALSVSQNRGGRSDAGQPSRTRTRYFVPMYFRYVVSVCAPRQSFRRQDSSKRRNWGRLDDGRRVNLL
jgi:hypothetical protein